MTSNDPLKELADALQQHEALVRQNVEVSMQSVESEHAFQAVLIPWFDGLAAGYSIERNDETERFVQEIDQAIEERLPLLASSMTTAGRRLALATPFDQSIDVAPSLEALAASSKSTSMLIRLRHAITTGWEH